MSRNVIIIICLLAAVSYGSDFWVTHDSVTNTQIWVEAENFDSKTTEFVVDEEALNPSGSALYFPDYSDRTTIDQWWAEYSIDSADTQVVSDPNVDLTGTWYCWVRVNQPVVDAEEADFLLVKGDSGDGSGATWYDTAIAGVDDADDMLCNDLATAEAVGPGMWRWIGIDASSGGVPKEFAVDSEGKIVFRINEREGNSGNARIDAICWTDDASFTPTDRKFSRAVISDNLIFEINAAHAGDMADYYWPPIIGSGTGELIDSPALNVEDNGDDTYNWFYRFYPPAGGYDQVVNIGDYSDFSVVDTGWCTIEAWVRVPALIPNSKIKSIIIGNVDGAETGWRFGVRCNTSGKWAPAFLQRDNETAETALTGTLHYLGSFVNDYSTTEWTQIVFVKYAAEYNSSSQISINHDWYVNGIKDTHGVRTLAASAIDDFYFPQVAPQIGTFRSDQSLVAEVAMVRVYDKQLYPDEVLANYQAGIASLTDWQCGGLTFDNNGDCKVDLADFALMAGYWMADNSITP